MAKMTRRANAALLLFTILAHAPISARANLYTLAASGTITANTSGDPTIPIGTPWSFEITYNTAAPDLDFQVGGSPDPTFGRFNNTSAVPALTFFHYKAGSYEATLDDPADFGTFSGIDTTFTSINAIDINISAPTLFPPLAGRPVSFHADFNRFIQPPVFSSDGLPTNTAISAASFDPNTVSLLPQSPPTSEVSGNNLASLTIALSGDFNNDGTVDAADYVAWRKNFGSDQAKYNAWRANFGASLNSGSGSVLAPAELSSAAVPEPLTLASLALAALAAVQCRRRRRVTP